MTVIVWDGKTLAADRQTHYSGINTEVTKIDYLAVSAKAKKKYLIGYTGGLATALLMKKALNELLISQSITCLKNYDIADFVLEMPTLSRTEDNEAQILLIEKTFHNTGNSSIELFICNSSVAIFVPYEKEKIAIGSGAEMAFGALAMDATAEQAVAIACKYSNGCGLGIDTLNFPEYKNISLDS